MLPAPSSLAPKGPPKQSSLFIGRFQKRLQIESIRMLGAASIRTETGRPLSAQAGIWPSNLVVAFRSVHVDARRPPEGPLLTFRASKPQVRFRPPISVPCSRAIIFPALRRDFHAIVRYQATL